MPLDPVARALIGEIDKVFATIGTEIRDPAEARRRMEVTPDTAAKPIPVGSAEDCLIPGPGGDTLRVRLYRPMPSVSEPWPAVVFLHGGGWVLGSLNGHDGLCRLLCNNIRAVIVSVDYRLAPEHPFPAALNDAEAALRWLSGSATRLGVDPARLVVAGDSAGGNLAAAAALRARDSGGPPIAFQLLIYPVLDPTLETASYRENGEGYLLTTAHMRWFWDLYAEPGLCRNPYAAPALAPDLAGLPAAHIVTAEFDPLRDEGTAYAERLRAIGINATDSCYPGVFHGFIGFGSILPVARQAFDEATERVRAAIGWSG